jgi:Leucine-rich repeat (LRR) protein
MSAKIEVQDTSPPKGQEPAAPGNANLEVWMKEVASLPADKQLEAVVQKLKELNPGFDGKATHKIADGVVTEFRINPNHVTEISPLRALSGLKQLNFEGVGGQDLLADLSPLRGLRLVALNCERTRVSDLSPLKGMPLRDLRCDRTLVSDLSPLAGMPLVHLQCARTRVADLAPLRTLKLEFLSCDATAVSDLSPLKGMPLTDIQIDDTKVTDLSPLKECPKLKLLKARQTKITAAGVAELQKAAPNCKIEWDGAEGS